MRATASPLVVCPPIGTIAASVPSLTVAMASLATAMASTCCVPVVAEVVLNGLATASSIGRGQKRSYSFKDYRLGATPVLIKCSCACIAYCLKHTTAGQLRA